MASKPKKPEIEYEAEDSCDVFEDTVWRLDGHGNPIKVEVADDV